MVWCGAWCVVSRVRVLGKCARCCPSFVSARGFTVVELYFNINSMLLLVVFLLLVVLDNV